MIDPRERLSGRFNRARFELEVRRSVRPLVVLAGGGVVGLACWFFLFANVGGNLFTSHYDVRFALNDATSVVAGRHDVRLKGIKVGEITKVQLADGKPVLTAQIASKWGRIYRDARARLRPNTALEDMYLDIVDRGSKPAGVAAAREPIAASQTRSSVQIEEVLQAFNPDVRGRLRILLANLGNGLADRGTQLREAFQRLTPLLKVTGDVSNAFATRSRQTRRLMHNFASLTAELRRRDTGLRRLVDAGGAALGTLGDNSESLDATLHELPATVQELDRSLATVHGVLPDVDRALVALRPSVRALPEGLKGLSELSRSADPALRALQPTVASLRPLSRSLRPASAGLADSAKALLPQVPALDHVAKKTADCTIAIYGFFQWTASVTKFWDSLGVFPRGDAAVSINAPGGVARDPNSFPASGCMGGKPKLATP